MAQSQGPQTRWPFSIPQQAIDDDQVCGDKVYDRGLQRLVATVYAIDKINNDYSGDT